jgi:transcriptional regulator of arginine metabolism
MAVIKTLPGFASGIAYRIDGMNAFEIIGTIAGDDTILIIARDGVSRPDLHNLLTTAIPEAGIRNSLNNLFVPEFPNRNSPL